MHPTVARSVFRIQEGLLGRETFSILNELEKSQWWSRQDIEELQLMRLKNLVSHAYDKSPYWQKIFGSNGLLPSDINTLNDLKKLPLMDKEALRANRENIAVREGRRIMLMRTSGSTNEALQFYTNSFREASINASRIRGHRWIGQEIGEKEAYFWGAPVELSRQDRIKKFRDLLINNHLTNAMELTLDVVPRYLETWKRWRPKCIFGYPNSFVLFADMATKLGLDLCELKRFGLQLICTSSEVLGEENRKFISKAFGVPVYDSYGLREGGLIGHDCKNSIMHCNDEQLILETIDPLTLEPTEGEGELVLTSLISHVMPIIRYRTGDIVTLSKDKCDCGLSLSQVYVSGGRIADFIVTLKGKWVVGYSFIYICRAVLGIDRFQIVQEQIGRLKVLLQVNDEFPKDGEEQVLAGIRARLKSDEEIDVHIVDEIEMAPSGKYRPVIGKVADQLREQHLYTVQ